MAYTPDEITALSYALRHLVREWERRRITIAHRHEMTQSELAALGYLYVSGPMTPGELGEQLQLTSGSVTALIDRLVLAGLARREEHPADRRRLYVVFTDHAAAMLAAAHQDFQDSLAEVLAAHPVGSLPDVTQMLTTLAGELPNVWTDLAPARPGDAPHRAG